MFVNGKLVKLGKKPAPKVPDPRNLKLKKYLKEKLTIQQAPGIVAVGAGLPPAPVEASWITKLCDAEAIAMYDNDVLGDCVPAAMAHMEQQWNFYAGHPWIPWLADVIAAYQAIGGYVPGDSNTDNGCDMSTALKYWRKTGFAGHKILAYMVVDSTDLDEVQSCIEIFGNMFTGIALPVSVQGAYDWTVPEGGIYSDNGQPGSWGGHCIPIVAGSPITKTCETWGVGKFKMSNNFERDYVDEAYAVLSPDWLEAGKISPSLLDLEQLESDLKALDKP
jgi:hypothetical protein